MLIGGIAGLNVFVVLLVGILAGAAIVLPTGTVDFMALADTAPPEAEMATSIWAP